MGAGAGWYCCRGSAMAGSALLLMAFEALAYFPAAAEVERGAQIGRFDGGKFIRQYRGTSAARTFENAPSPYYVCPLPDPRSEAFPNRSDDHGTLRNLQQSDFSSECSPKSPGGLHIPTPQYSVHTRELPAVPAAAEAVLLGLAFPQWMLPGVQLGANKKKQRNHCTVPRKGIRSV
ncbi:hypothetical protein B0H11DRAFT_1936748 [Mycena galericulata]|nr:hypothetical protein B0H11DRAFT_1936748 [Mycena galericulata]